MNTKVCTQCKKEKSLEDFQRNSSACGCRTECRKCNNKRNATYKRKRYKQNTQFRTKRLTTSKSWREKQKENGTEEYYEHRRKRDKTRYNRQRKQILEYRRKWLEKQGPGYAQKQSAKISKRISERRKTDPEFRKYSNAYVRARKDRLKNQFKALSKEEKKAVVEFYRNCPRGYEVDHIIPIAKGGPHHISNLQYLTTNENRHKSSKLNWSSSPNYERDGMSYEELQKLSYDELEIFLSTLSNQEDIKKVQFSINNYFSF